MTVVQTPPAGTKRNRRSRRTHRCTPSTSAGGAGDSDTWPRCVLHHGGSRVHATLVVNTVIVVTLASQAPGVPARIFVITLSTPRTLPSGTTADPLWESCRRGVERPWWHHLLRCRQKIRRWEGAALGEGHSRTGSGHRRWGDSNRCWRRLRRVNSIRGGQQEGPPMMAPFLPGGLERRLRRRLTVMAGGCGSKIAAPLCTPPGGRRRRRRRKLWLPVMAGGLRRLSQVCRLCFRLRPRPPSPRPTNSLQRRPRYSGSGIV